MYIIKEAKNLEISKEFCGISKYKLLFKTMGRIQLHEEEAIVWNVNLQNMLVKKEELFKKEYDNIMNSDRPEEEKLEYRYNKFFFEEFAKDMGPLDHEVVKSFEQDLSHMNKTVILEPSLKQFFSMFEEYGHIPISIKVFDNDFPEYKMVWSFWTNIPEEDRIIVLYVITLHFHYVLNDKGDITDEKIIELYNI